MRIPATLLTQTCLIKPLIGITPKGPKYSTEFSAKCRLELINKRYGSPKGKEYTRYGRIFLLPDANILALEQDSIITIDSVEYILAEKNTQRGFTVSHMEGVVV